MHACHRREAGATDTLACRVCIVNDQGHVLLDCWVKPSEPVTDYRTFVSGVRKHHLTAAATFDTIRPKVTELTTGRTIVGHALHNDLNVSSISLQS